MACSDYTELWKFIADFEGQAPVDAVVCFFSGQMGMGLFAALVFGGAGLAMTVRTQSLAPALVANMFGAVTIFALVPGVAAKIGAIVIFLGLTVAGYVLYQRSSSAL